MKSGLPDWAHEKQPTRVAPHKPYPWPAPAPAPFTTRDGWHGPDSDDPGPLGPMPGDRVREPPPAPEGA